MITLEIKYANGTSFKEVHDMIMDINPDCVEFIEVEGNDADEDPNVAFTLAHFIKNFGYFKIKNLIYSTYRDDFPMDLLDPNIVFRGIPFNTVILNNKIYTFNEEY